MKGFFSLHDVVSFLSEWFWHMLWSLCTSPWSLWCETALSSSFNELNLRFLDLLPAWQERLTQKDVLAFLLNFIYPLLICLGRRMYWRWRNRDSPLLVLEILKCRPDLQGFNGYLKDTADMKQIKRKCSFTQLITKLWNSVMGLGGKNYKCVRVKKIDGSNGS